MSSSPCYSSGQSCVVRQLTGQKNCFLFMQGTETQRIELFGTTCSVQARPLESLSVAKKLVKLNLWSIDFIFLCCLVQLICKKLQQQVSPSIKIPTNLPEKVKSRRSCQRMKLLLVWRRTRLLLGGKKGERTPQNNTAIAVLLRLLQLPLVHGGGGV